MENSKLNPYRVLPNDKLKSCFSYHGETYSNTSEQDIITSLVAEKITQFGYKAIYMPFTLRNNDNVFGEGNRLFNHKFEIPVDYDINGMTFATSILQLGWNMQDSIIIECSYKVLNDKIKKLKIGRNIPLPGDQLKIPTLGTKGMLLNINYADAKTPSNPLGTNLLWKLSCTPADIATETYTTEIPNIDNISIDYDKEVKEVFSDIPDIVEETRKATIKEPNAWENLLNDKKV